jgi:polyisoprenoid-binding protein YceI
LHTVHGTFQLKSGNIRFNPATGAATGLVVVDTTSGNTQNEGRDHKMHREVLESAKYPEATFSPNRISGEFHREGESRVQVSGVLRLHGSDHPVTVDIPVQVHGNVLTAATRMVIPYVAWGLKNPSTFILRVSDKAEMDVKTTGRLAP